MILFLDMDGVLSDFVGGMCRAHNRDSPFTNPANIGKYDMAEAWGMPPREFYAPANYASFWIDLDPTPEFKKVKKLASTYFPSHNIFIATTPTLSPNSAKGKLMWVEKHWPEMLRQTIILAPKWILAQPDTVLLDDHVSNAAQFRMAGGQAIVFPRPWNGAAYFDNPMPHVERAFSRLGS